MTAISDAERALARNWPMVAFYILTTIACVAAADLLGEALKAYVPEDLTPKPFWYVAVTLVKDLVLAALIAALQSVVFAALGEEIDRPLWKNDGYRDALRRFFGTWFIIALIHMAFIRIEVSLSQLGLPEAVLPVVVPHMLWMGIYVPIGACIMYGGRLVWNEVPDRLSPILYVTQKSLVAIGLGCLQFVIWIFMLPYIPKAPMEAIAFFAVLNFPLLLLECLGFAIMWHACMEYRDTAPERDDDLDF